MRGNFLFYAAVPFFIFATTIFGQNAAQIRGKYGRPTEAYSVSERIWMTPEFTRDGQVCRMRLYPKAISATTNYLSDNLTNGELKEVLEKLVPPETRGRKTDFFGIMSMGGFSVRTLYIYEKVSFTFLASGSPFADPIEKGELPPRETTSSPSDRKAVRSTIQGQEMTMPDEVDRVTIVWLRRKCAKE